MNDGCDDEEQRDCINLEVQPSTIEGAGDGLFLMSDFVMEGRCVLAEDAVPIKRPLAKQILQMPEWKDMNPVIQGNRSEFLDIRRLLLWKSNHAPATSWNCNVALVRTGHCRLQLVALRDIYEGEELMWEYAKNWCPPEKT